VTILRRAASQVDRDKETDKTTKTDNYTDNCMALERKQCMTFVDDICKLRFVANVLQLVMKP
jgi:hypothetical protein